MNQHVIATTTFFARLSLFIYFKVALAFLFSMKQYIKTPLGKDYLLFHTHRTQLIRYMVVFTP